MDQEFIVPNRQSAGNSVCCRSFFTAKVAENKDGRPCLCRSYARIPPRPQLKMHDSTKLSKNSKNTGKLHATAFHLPDTGLQYVPRDRG